MNGARIVFYLLASLSVIGAVGVITRRSAVHSALFLLASLLGVAGIFIVLEAEFLAAVQVLVYAGGILVLFLFVIMLVDIEERGAGVRTGGPLTPDPQAVRTGGPLMPDPEAVRTGGPLTPDPQAGAPGGAAAPAAGSLAAGTTRLRRPRLAVILGAAIAGLFVVTLLGIVGRPGLAGAPLETGALNADGGNIGVVAMAMFRSYLLPFEIASLLLLVAMIGAVVMARPPKA